MQKTLTLRPNADVSIQLGNSAGSGTNYDKIDEATLDESDYVKCSWGTDQKDLYGWPNHSAEQQGKIIEVIAYAQAEYIRSGSGGSGEKVYFCIPDDGHQTEIGTLTTTSTLFHQHFAINPHTGAAWTWAEIDALTAGLRLVVGGEFGNQDAPYVYQYYLEVIYDTTGDFFQLF
jgi:hypothetical protein